MQWHLHGNQQLLRSQAVLDSRQWVAAGWTSLVRRRNDFVDDPRMPFFHFQMLLQYAT